MDMSFATIPSQYTVVQFLSELHSIPLPSRRHSLSYDKYVASSEASSTHSAI